MTFGTTPGFLDHFGLESIGDLPGLADLKAAGLIESLAVPGDDLPAPNDNPELAPDEDPLEPDFDEYGATEGGEEPEDEPAEPEQSDD